MIQIRHFPMQFYRHLPLIHRHLPARRRHDPAVRPVLSVSNKAFAAFCRTSGPETAGRHLPPVGRSLRAFAPDSRPRPVYGGLWKIPPAAGPGRGNCPAPAAGPRSRAPGHSVLSACMYILHKLFCIY